MKKVVILGGGFAGVTVGLTLIKNLKQNEAEITLVDENTFQTFHPSLYEVATSEEPKKNIALPFKGIFLNNINFINKKIDKVDIQKQSVIFSDGQIAFWDYLLFCLGSQTNYFSIPGLEKYSFPLSNLKDAIQIKNKINNSIIKTIQSGQKANIIIGGGGFSGTELAAEIVNLQNIIFKNNPKLCNLLNVTILEAKVHILAGLDSKVSGFAQNRLNSLNINTVNNCLIKEVEINQLKTSDDQIFPFDLLIWTGGIKGNSILEKSGLPVDKSGRVPVNDYLQIQGYENLYAAGDCALFTDPNTQKPAPQTAQIAIGEGKIVGKNISSQILEKIPSAFKMKNYSYIVPLKGRYAIADLRFIKLIGFFGWILQQVVFLQYLFMILPFSKALKKWNRFELELKQE